MKAGYSSISCSFLLIFGVVASSGHVMAGEAPVLAERGDLAYLDWPLANSRFDFAAVNVYHDDARTLRTIYASQLQKS